MDARRFTLDTALDEAHAEVAAGRATGQGRGGRPLTDPNPAVILRLCAG
jgi:hypothetical protein